LNNIVCALEGVVARHGLTGCEFFIFTNNSTAEGAFWRGASKSKKLFDLVLRLKELEIKHNLNLHVVHVDPDD
jgi:hypothetical protein